MVFEPVVAGDVVGAGVVVHRDECEGAHEVVDVGGLDGGGGAAHLEVGASEQEAGGETLGAGAQDRRGAQDRDRGAWVIVAPLDEEALSFGGLHCRGEVRVRAEGRVLREGDGVVRPRAVHRRARHAHDLGDADRGRGVEHATRAFHVHASHQRLVGDRVDDRRKVHQHLNAFEQRLELATSDIGEMELESLRPPRRLANVEADEAGHGGVVGEHTHQSPADEARGAGDGDRGHAP